MLKGVRFEALTRVWRRLCGCVAALPGCLWLGNAAVLVVMHGMEDSSGVMAGDRSWR